MICILPIHPLYPLVHSVPQYTLVCFAVPLCNVYHDLHIGEHQCTVQGTCTRVTPPSNRVLIVGCKQAATANKPPGSAAALIPPLQSRRIETKLPLVALFTSFHAFIPWTTFAKAAADFAAVVIIIVIFSFTHWNSILEGLFEFSKNFFAWFNMSNLKSFGRTEVVVVGAVFVCSQLAGERRLELSWGLEMCANTSH